MQEKGRLARYVVLQLNMIISELLSRLNLGAQIGKSLDKNKHLTSAVWGSHTERVKCCRAICY